MSLPKFYIDNETVKSSETLVIRGNQVSDIHGATAVGISVSNVHTLRAKNNKVVRVRSSLGQATCYDISDVENSLFVYNVASRSNTGFSFRDIGILDVYNATGHLCDTCISTETITVSSTFRNLAFSAYQEYDLYNSSIGIAANDQTLDVDYVSYFGLANIATDDGSVLYGAHIYQNQILYLDEPNDDLTPDYISELVGEGAENPLLIAAPDIGGVQSAVTDEETAVRNYWYELIDNSFWDVSNPYSGEATFVKSVQSRTLASSEVQVTQVVNDLYIKECASTLRFSDLYPMYARYANSTQFKKRVMDMWFAGQNAGTLQAYQNAIGGYNYLPSFFKRAEDDVDTWIVAESYVNHDNWLGGYAELKYGIHVDVLGTSTMNQATSGECYTNTQNTVADVASVRWFLHNEVQPAGYLMFVDGYNSFEDCELTNMHYNDDYNISIYETGSDGQIITPLIPTTSVLATSVGENPVEVSVLDRNFSEEITRTVYYRQGPDEGSMSAWTELTQTISGVIAVTESYLQFKILVEGVTSEIDYEFMGIGLRAYSGSREWSKPQRDEVAVWVGSLYYTGLADYSVYVIDTFTLYSQFSVLNAYDYEVNNGTFAWNNKNVYCVGSLPSESRAKISWYDGHIWKLVYTSLGTGGSSVLNAIHGISPGDMWSAGYKKVSGISYPFICRGYETTWYDETPSGTGLSDRGELYSVFGVASDLVWVGGINENLGEAYFWIWDGSSWTSVDTSLPLIFTSLWGIDSENLWIGARDYSGTKGYVYKWDGDVLTCVLDGAVDTWVTSLNVIFGTSENDIWAAGTDSTIAHWDGDTWTQVTITELGLTMTSIWGDAANNVYIAGYDPYASGYVYHWNGSALRKVIEASAWPLSLSGPHT